jgi:cation transport regulator ChaC
VLLLLAAVYLTVSQFRRSRASSYIERFNSSDALASRVAVDRWLREHDTPRARLEAVDRDAELYTHVRRFANLFQELGAAYQFRVAHRKTVRVLFDALVIMYWKALRFWIYDYRAHADPTLYARFEYLYREMASAKRGGGGVRAEYVLAYGSLMEPASATAAVGRPVSIDDYVPITLVGWARRWSVGEAVMLEAGGEVVAAFLDVEPDAASETPAVMFRVSSKEMERLRVREKNYEARDLRDDVRLTGGRPVEAGAAVWCFVGRPAHRLEQGFEQGLEHESGDVVLLARYLERVARAARQVDAGLETALRVSAADSGFAAVDGDYTFVDARQAKLV